METISDPKEVWEQKYQEARDLRRQIYSAARTVGLAGSKWLDFLAEEIDPRLKKITGLENTNDLRRFAVFHPIIGSSVDFKLCPEIDLPGDIITNFLKKILEKLQAAEATGSFDPSSLDQ